MRFSRSAAAMLPNAISTTWTSRLGSSCFDFSQTRSARSTAEPKALMPIFLPLRSAGPWIGESLRTKKVFDVLPGLPSW